MDAKLIAPQTMQFRRDFTAQQVRMDPGRPNDSRITVLLVDNDLAARDPVADYLESCGICVTAVSDSQRAGHQLAAREPTLVILNLDPAGGDDLVLLRAIRSRSDVPVILA